MRRRKQRVRMRVFVGSRKPKNQEENDSGNEGYRFGWYVGLGLDGVLN